MTDTPSNSVTPLEGKTTIDSQMFFEPERLSYQSADCITEIIAREVREEVKDQVVVIAGTHLLADFANLQSVYLMLGILRGDYDALAMYGRRLVEGRSLMKPEELENFKVLTPVEAITETISAAVVPVTTLLNATLGLVSLFREDVEYHGLKTVVDPLAFEIALASKVKDEGATKVFVPDLMVVPPTEARTDSLSHHLYLVQEAKSRAWAVVGPLITELVRLEGELDQAAKDNDQERLDQLSAEVSELRRDMQPVSDPLGRADQRWADLQNQWNQSNDSSALPLLSRLLRAEAILAAKPLYLHATVVSSGGHHRISRNLFRMLFLGDGLSFAGGATVRWALLENDGSVAKGGIIVESRSTSS